MTFSKNKKFIKVNGLTKEYWMTLITEQMQIKATMRYKQAGPTAS